MWGDAGYLGAHKREENLGLDLEWRVAMRPGRPPDAGGEGVGRLSVVIAQVGKGWNCRTVARSMVQEVSVNS